MNFHIFCSIAQPSQNKRGSLDLLSKFVVAKEFQKDRVITSKQKENETSIVIQLLCKENLYKNQL